ncbi:hypothetical protein [Mucilaginibacter sp.]|uniref:DUF6934 family protein n=1 Tax=Mucilaginibacter sp. TaxID=1882438 RepID=UPI0032647D79
MNLLHYNYLTTDYQGYEFYSEGRKESIKKLVTFAMIQEEPVIYNLAFGDADPETGLMNDSVTSNNEDRDIVLATVANTVSAFCDHHGDHFIYAKGSTPVRTRLYQMGINGIIDEISVDFNVYGVIGDTAYVFEKNVNYEAFLVKRK